MKGRLAIKIFRSKCQQVYNEWLKQQPEPVREQDQLKLTKHWIHDWMKEHNVNLRKPNRKYAIKKEDRIIRIKGYLKNIWTVRKYFINKYGVGPPVFNGDQMPFRRNKAQVRKHFIENQKKSL